jgi:Fe-S-cluster-containing dehydrogenase component
MTPQRDGGGAGRGFARRSRSATRCGPHCATSSRWRRGVRLRAEPLRCIGCRKCVHACVAENNQSRSPEIQYIRVIEMPRGTLDVEKGNHHYDHPTVPDAAHFYMPVQCHQCANPPCVKVCPVEATWQEPDGITVIDYDWCIGCRYCEAACPYWARRFNFAKPNLPKDQLNPNMSVPLQPPAREGRDGEVPLLPAPDARGRMPACVEICPTGARKFGNVLDPKSEVSRSSRPSASSCSRKRWARSRASSTTSMSGTPTRSTPRRRDRRTLKAEEGDGVRVPARALTDREGLRRGGSRRNGGTEARHENLSDVPLALLPPELRRRLPLLRVDVRAHVVRAAGHQRLLPSNWCTGWRPPA